jgi:predicted nuclease of predicted toxin-antitoxin system
VKILLDECVDERLARDFAGHEVLTVKDMGWKGKQNGDLLTLAENNFDILVTTDRNMSFQQNLTRLNISVVVLVAATNRLNDLRALIPSSLKLLPFLRKGEVRLIRV